MEGAPVGYLPHVGLVRARVGQRRPVEEASRADTNEKHEEHEPHIDPPTPRFSHRSVTSPRRGPSLSRRRRKTRGSCWVRILAREVSATGLHDCSYDTSIPLVSTRDCLPRIALRRCGADAHGTGQRFERSFYRLDREERIEKVAPFYDPIRVAVPRRTRIVEPSASNRLPNRRRVRTSVLGRDPEPAAVLRSRLRVRRAALLPRRAAG